MLMFGGVLNKTPDSGLPIGSIIMWYGQYNTIPEGWHICDGTNGTPNLKGKFVLGATGDNGTYGFKATGGEEKHTLTISEMPEHDHLVNGVFHKQFGGSTRASALSNVSQNCSDQVDTLYSGHSVPHNNMPPYYALYYIMKIA